RGTEAERADRRGGEGDPGEAGDAVAPLAAQVAMGGCDDDVVAVGRGSGRGHGDDLAPGPVTVSAEVVGGAITASSQTRAAGPTYSVYTYGGAIRRRYRIRSVGRAGQNDEQEGGVDVGAERAPGTAGVEPPTRLRAQEGARGADRLAVGAQRRAGVHDPLPSGARRAGGRGRRCPPIVGSPGPAPVRP